jgi:hypothetical protein
MIFCGNREDDLHTSDVNHDLMESLFSLTTSEDLHIMSTLPSSLLFISEVLTERAPDVNWT